jgi:hypothetical protein
MAAGLCAALALTTGAVRAEDYAFTNRAGGSFNAGANWSSGTVPGEADTALFTNNATYSVSWGATVTNASAFFDATGGTATLNPGSSTWRLEGDLNIGPNAAAAARVTLAGGTYNAGRLMLTNVTSGAGTSFLTLDSGTLTTRGANIHMATNGVATGKAGFRVGSTNNNANAFSWHIVDGTNRVTTYRNASGEFHIEAGNNVNIGGVNSSKTVIVNVRGSNTLFRVVGGALNVGSKDGFSAVGNNQLNITGGATVMASDLGAYIGWGSSYNKIVVRDSNSLYQANQLTFGKAGSGNLLIVTNGAKVQTSGNVTFGSDTSGKLNQLTVTGTNSVLETPFLAMGNSDSCSNTITILNGGKIQLTGNLNIADGGKKAGAGNTIRVEGPGTLLNQTAGSYALTIRGTNNSLLVSQGATAALVSLVFSGSGTGAKAVVSDAGSRILTGALQSNGDALIMVTNSGLFRLTGNSFKLAGDTAGGVPALVVSGAGSEFIATNALLSGLYEGFLGFSDGTGGPARMIVTNQGVARLEFTTNTVGNNGNKLLYVGRNTGTAGSSVYVGDGGLLDLGNGGLWVGNLAGNSVSNSGGVFQFASAAPSITPGAFGKIAVSDGTIAFRAIADADVKGNWTGTLANMLFDGNNTFRLDAATNLNSASQAYTFATGLGATNYVSLELFNGATYRGGGVTIGAGGSLTATGGVATIAGDLTFQAGGTCRLVIGGTHAYSRIAAGANVTLGGATLELQLRAPPQKDFPYLFIDNAGANPTSGQFATGSVTASFGGTNYVFAVRTNGGSGNDVVVGWFTKGTLIRVL